MACRHLNIIFLENGDIEYHFFKHHSEYKLYKYEIDYPFENVEIIGGQDFNIDNFKTIKTNNGLTLLTWDKLKESINGARGINYLKKNYLQKIEYGNRNYSYKYIEKIQIKVPEPGDSFVLYLHGINRSISAIKRKSRARFNNIQYQPRDLCEIVFNTPGILEIDWELELLSV